MIDPMVATDYVTATILLTNRHQGQLLRTNSERIKNDARMRKFISVKLLKAQLNLKL